MILHSDLLNRPEILENVVPGKFVGKIGAQTFYIPASKSSRIGNALNLVGVEHLEKAATTIMSDNKKLHLHSWKNVNSIQYRLVMYNKIRHQMAGSFIPPFPFT